MSDIQERHYCTTCQAKTLHVKPRRSNLLHLVLSVITAGLWLPVWIGLGLTNSAKRTRCQVCGSKPVPFAGMAAAVRRDLAA